MDSKKFKKIEEIYLSVLEVSPDERESYLDEKCANDAELKREVELLLSFENADDSFIEKHPDQLAAEIITENESKDYSNSKIGHFEIVNKIGKGGMGTVYLAKDTKLERNVAIKFLDKEFSQNEERLQRFILEAKAASALNHPNIITIHEIGEIDDNHFITTEFIEGETLRQKIKQNPFEIDDFLKVAIQIVSALEVAHKAGIIHRDIKPENIMIRPDGVVKVLDFGLVKRLSEKAEDGSLITKDFTGNRRVMGTMNYMSPEQALGEKLDARTDIFSLGVVFYEMLTGIQPFKGNSDAAVYDAMLNRTPSKLSDINENIPDALGKIIQLAIEKNKDERYQTLSKMRKDLRILKETSDSSLENNYSFSKTYDSQSSWRKPIFTSFVFIATLLISLAGYYLYTNYSQNSSTSKRATFDFKQLTSQGGEELHPSLSPDGKTMVYSSNNNGNWDVYFRRVDGENAINLTKGSDSDDLQAVFSPDGEKIAFRSERDGGGIFVMGATGESIKRITDDGYYPSWSPDGKEIVFSNGNFIEPTQVQQVKSSLFIVNLESGKIRGIKLKASSDDALQPSWSPRANRIAFWKVDAGGKREIFTVSVKGEDEVAVTEDDYLDWNPVWSPDGKYLYFSSNRGGSMNLWRIAIDENTGKTLSEFEPITTPSSYSQHISFARNGKRFLFAQSIKSTNIVKYNFNPETEEIIGNRQEITDGTKNSRNPRISPDGEWIAFDAVQNKQEDLFVMRIDGSDRRQITNDIHKDRGPVWSPDSKKLIFYSSRSGKYEGWVINADGSNLRQVTKTKVSNENNIVQQLIWSPNDDKILANYTHNFPAFIKTSEMFGNYTLENITRTLPDEKIVFASAWSPNGKKLAGSIFGANPNILGVFDYDIAKKDFEVLTDYGESPVWLNDNKRLVFFDVGKVYVIDTKTKKTKEIMSVSPNSFQNMDVSPDSRSLYFAMNKKEADIWLAEFQ